MNVLSAPKNSFLLSPRGFYNSACLTAPQTLEVGGAITVQMRVALHRARRLQLRPTRNSVALMVTSLAEGSESMTYSEQKPSKPIDRWKKTPTCSETGFSPLG
jgi:hypothetical protein